MGVSVDPLLRFKRKIFIDRLVLPVPHLGPCWLWTGCTNTKGYAILQVYGNGLLAHRWYYELTQGQLDDSITLDHLCRIHRCVNPDHLEPVTSQVNILRGIGIAAVNAAKTHCPRGHEYTKENTLFYESGRQCRTCKFLFRS